MVALGEYEKGIDDSTQSLIQKNSRGIAHLIRGGVLMQNLSRNQMPS